MVSVEDAPNPKDLQAQERWGDLSFLKGRQNPAHSMMQKLKMYMKSREKNCEESKRELT